MLVTLLPIVTLVSPLRPNASSSTLLTQHYCPVSADDLACAWHTDIPIFALCDCIPLLNRTLKIDSTQITTTPESVLAYVRHAVANCHTCQTVANIEGRNADARHAVRDCYVCQTTAIIESTVANGGQLAVLSELHTCQTTAIAESPLANGGHTVRDDYVCQTSTIIEGT